MDHDVKHTFSLSRSLDPKVKKQERIKHILALHVLANVCIRSVRSSLYT